MHRRHPTRARGRQAKTEPALAPSEPTTGDPCDTCTNAAAAGNFGVAAQSLKSCTDATKKSACISTAKSNAPNAAKTAALNGNCGQAQAIIAAAKGTWARARAHSLLPSRGAPATSGG